ncbi:hypothetical protein D9611_002864 [Ephemerocybe angulata]|uniref:HMG box domain-containing protein n=1 Tax=Ephemerocybe angulata TaxID=980116 RepID=A0A8H5C8J7_9AGAR|nr:hypothetical protein D9611_002864 [Tulosesus angulatus]
MSNSPSPSSSSHSDKGPDDQRTAPSSNVVAGPSTSGNGSARHGASSSNAVPEVQFQYSLPPQYRAPIYYRTQHATYPAPVWPVPNYTTASNDDDCEEEVAEVETEPEDDGGNGKGKEKEEEKKIPRPANSFILFRKAFCADMKSKLKSDASIGADTQPKDEDAANDKDGDGDGGDEAKPLPLLKVQSDVSKEAGKRWRALLPHERALWDAKAVEAKEEHKRKYPGYRYRPIKKSKKTRAVQPKGSERKATVEDGGSDDDEELDRPAKRRKVRKERDFGDVRSFSVTSPLLDSDLHYILGLLMPAAGPSRLRAEPLPPSPPSGDVFDEPFAAALGNTNIATSAGPLVCLAQDSSILPVGLEDVPLQGLAEEQVYGQPPRDNGIHGAPAFVPDFALALQNSEQPFAFGQNDFCPFIPQGNFYPQNFINDYALASTSASASASTVQPFGYGNWRPSGDEIIYYGHDSIYIPDHTADLPGQSGQSASTPGTDLPGGLDGDGSLPLPLGTESPTQSSSQLETDLQEFMAEFNDYISSQVPANFAPSAEVSDSTLAPVAAPSPAVSTVSDSAPSVSPASEPMPEPTWTLGQDVVEGQQVELPLGGSDSQALGDAASDEGTCHAVQDSGASDEEAGSRALGNEVESEK